MKKIGLLSFVGACLLLLAAQGNYEVNGSNSLQQNRTYTLIVYHDECTECGDFEIDSGEVIVPVQLRQDYVDARYKQMLYRNRTREQIEQMACARNYEVGSLRLNSEAAFDSLFLLPGRSRNDTIRNRNGFAYPWDFRRVYRVQGEISGISGVYLQFKVHKAVLLARRIEY